ncbi:MAG: hypothetical protein Q9172_001000 [Xanthocarpia lactea]
MYSAVTGKVELLEEPKLTNITPEKAETMKTCTEASPPVDVVSAMEYYAEILLAFWYLDGASNWPAHKVHFHGKRIAIVGTGSTGVHLIPKLAPVAKELTVFQRSPNYVLPGRNHAINVYQAIDIQKNHGMTWELAILNLAGHACKASGKTVKGVAAPVKIRQIFNRGWERGCFNFQMETFDDIFMDPESNEQAAEFIRLKIRAIVQDPGKAKLSCPKYPFSAKRPPSGHFYYETFNRPNVKLVDISRDEIELDEKGIRTSSGVGHEIDMVIFALGFMYCMGRTNELQLPFVAREKTGFRESLAASTSCYSNQIQ